MSDDADERFDCHSRVVGRRRCVVDDRLRTFGATSPTAASSACMGTLTGAGLRPHSRFNRASVKSIPFLNSAFTFLIYGIHTISLPAVIGQNDIGITKIFTKSSKIFGRTLCYCFFNDIYTITVYTLK